MKLAFFKSLTGSETLAKDIVSNDGKVLLSAGTSISLELISKLKSLGFFNVYIEDNRLDDIHDDKVFQKLKQNSLETLPVIFNSLTVGNTIDIKNTMDVFYSLFDYIITKDETVSANLFDIKNYDNYTYVHCIDTAMMSIFLGTALGLDKNLLKELGIASILHDIGKTKISNSIINKKAPLTKEEFAEIKKHTIYGRNILSSYDIVSENILRGVTEHHERIDGKGYPYGLKGNEINYLAKIVSLCDVFSAVSAKRCYRDKFDPQKAYDLILSSSNLNFDPEIVNVFMKTFSVYPLGCCVKLSNGIEGYVVKQNKAAPYKPVIRVLYDEFTKKSIQPFEINLLSCNNINIINLVE